MNPSVPSVGVLSAADGSTPPEESSIRCFLSHTGADAGISDLIYDWLTVQGVSVWYSREMADPGARIRPKVMEALRQSTCLIAVLSRRTVAGENTGQWVGFEIRRFREFHPEGRILPIRVDDVDLQDVDPALGNYEYLDFRHLRDGLKALCHALEIPYFQDLLRADRRRGERRVRKDQRNTEDLFYNPRDPDGRCIGLRLRVGFRQAYYTWGYSAPDATMEMLEPIHMARQFHFMEERKKLVSYLSREIVRYTFVDRATGEEKRTEREAIDILQEAVHYMICRVRDRYAEVGTEYPLPEARTINFLEGIARRIWDQYRVTPKDRRQGERRSQGEGQPQSEDRDTEGSPNRFATSPTR
ncbi:MAG: toll/interleukin-1 receptor domain-containing protein [Capsulimonadales bacterium]|nr:toll/interleukin-1 receptor domain-containing protein [Capsulimonadales bacterium]